jgi:hypothetical protein
MLPFLLLALDLPSILLKMRSHGEIAFVLGVLLVWFLVQWGREKLRVRRTKNWPTLDGEILKLGYEKVWGGVNGIDYWKVTIEYQYSATGKNGQTGNYSGKYKFNCTSEEMAQGAVAGLKDKPVRVHYDPKKPASNLLWEDDVWDIWWDTYWQLSHPDETPAENQA